MVEDDGAGLGGGEDVGEREPGIVGGGVVVAGAAGEALGADAREGFGDLARVEQARIAHVAEERQGVIELEAGDELPALQAGALVDGPDEGQGAHQVGGEPQQPVALDAGFEDEAEVAVLQVAHAAVDEAGGAAGGAGGEVLALHECHAQAPQGGVASDAATGDAAADDEDIELLGGESEQPLGAGGGRLRGGGSRGEAVAGGDDLGDGFRTHDGSVSGAGGSGSRKRTRCVTGVGYRASIPSPSGKGTG